MHPGDTTGSRQAARAAVLALALGASAALPVNAFDGPYIGALIGSGSFDRESRVAAFANPVAAPGTGSDNLTSINGTVLAGWNFRLSHRFLAGIEGDYSFGDWSGTIAGDHHGINHLFTLRARLGYVARDRLMIYGTAGFATALQEVGGATTFPASRERDDTVSAGWTVGVGIEYELNNIFNLRAELLYVDFNEWAFDTAVNRHVIDTSGVNARFGIVIPLTD